MPPRPRIDPARAAENMAEIEPRYGPQEAAVEAERCLYCFDAPCIHSCPTGIDVPAFIRKIATGNLTGAARTILEANVLGASCARVCPTEVLCEGACVLLGRDHKPIKIGRLQRHATDHVLDADIPVLDAAATRSGKKVAVIGGGPAGLGCAAELAQLGHDAVVFERKPHAGGLNTYGVAYYKMRPEVSLREVELVRGLGVEIRENVEVGRDISVDDLRREFDAVFLGVGLGRARALDVPGEDLEGVVDALAFIEEVHTSRLHEVRVGRRVAVIGGGNTAIDAATQAKRLGAEQVVIVYRRGEERIPAYDFEYELARRDGVEFLFDTLAVAILGTERVTGLRLAKTRTTAEGVVETLGDGELEMPFDMVIRAVGQTIRDALDSMIPDLELDARRMIRRDLGTGRTNLPWLYAGGDAANGGLEVVNAVAEGKRAAREMHRVFTGQVVDGPVQTSRHGAPGGSTGAGFESSLPVADLEREYRASGGKQGTTHG